MNWGMQLGEDAESEQILEERLSEFDADGAVPLFGMSPARGSRAKKARALT